MTDLVIFTAANICDEPFVLPYMASCAWFNPNAAMEIRVENRVRFHAENNEGLAVLERHFPGRCLVTQGEYFSRVPNSVRFLQKPSLAAEYVYIGDVDILVLEEIVPRHLQNMADLRLPYSNIERPHGKGALSGLHFTARDTFYPQASDGTVSRINCDEYVLYDLIIARGLPMPDISHRVRPIHGYHLSLNRDPRIVAG